MKKSISSTQNANIPQLFLLDKLVSGQGLKCNKKNFVLLFPIEKQVERRVRKKWYFEKFFLGKTQKHKFLFQKKLNWGSVSNFQVPYRYGMYGTWPKKILKVLTKIPIFTYSTLVHLDSTLNHSKSCRELFFVHSVQF